MGALEAALENGGLLNPLIDSLQFLIPPAKTPPTSVATRSALPCGWSMPTRPVAIRTGRCTQCVNAPGGCRKCPGAYAPCDAAASQRTFAPYPPV